MHVKWSDDLKHGPGSQLTFLIHNGVVVLSGEEFMAVVGNSMVCALS